MTYTLYGALVGGPDANGSYDDNTDSYSCTEPALDYNGCFALAAAGLTAFTAVPQTRQMQPLPAQVKSRATMSLITAGARLFRSQRTPGRSYRIP